jgi:23S rRNA (guanosine2251-2'-O)-methyltransferase
MQIILVIHNIRSVHNVGSLFRTADGVGVSEIIVSGYTPLPYDRFSRLRTDFQKTALGSEQSVSWRCVESLPDTISEFKSKGFEILGLEQDVRSIHYKKYTSKKDVVVIIGNEVDGIDAEILSLCDTVVEIPMSGEKESLNVAIATGVLLFSLRDRT